MKVYVDIKVLQKLEWIADEFTGATGGRCHICGGYKWGGPKGRLLHHSGEFEGHTPDCELAIVIERAQK